MRNKNKARTNKNEGIELKAIWGCLWETSREKKNFVFLGSIFFSNFKPKSEPRKMDLKFLTIKFDLFCASFHVNFLLLIFM